MKKLHLVLALLLAAISISYAQGPAPSPLLSPAPAATPGQAQPEIAPPDAPRELTKADLEAFFDGLIPAQLRSRDIAGAVVAVVKDDGVLLAKGYGFADFEKQKPVVAEETLFRPGSIAKLFTAIAVMQLVEQGRLDLDRDVRDYVDFEITRRYPEPITLRRILTHTAGWEETIKNLFVPAEGNIGSLRDYLVAAMPVQIFRPGSVPSYSNYAITLAGYIVERTSGQRFDEYIAQHVLQPLGMRSSTFAQPLPPELASRMSNGYQSAGKRPKPFELVQAGPAGALTSSAADMSRFMLALLHEGTLEGASILRPETLREMQSRQFELHPALHAMGLVFMDYSANEQTIWGHGGDTIYFHSDMMVMPQARVGVFISYNSAGARPGGGRGEVMRAFLDRYFPVPLPNDPTIDAETQRADGRAVSGVYQSSRRAESSWLKIGNLLGGAKVETNADGVLTIEGQKNSRLQPKKWKEVRPLLYREINGPGMVAFRRDRRGVVSEMLPQIPVAIAQRVRWFERKTIMLPVVGASLGLIALTLVTSFVTAGIRKYYGRQLLPDRFSRVLFVLSRLECAIIVAMVAVLAMMLTRLNDDISILSTAANPWLMTVHILGWIGAAGVLLLIWTAVRYWRTIGIGKWTRVHAALLALSAIVFFAFAWHANLLSASLRF